MQIRRTGLVGAAAVAGALVASIASGGVAAADPAVRAEASAGQSRAGASGQYGVGLDLATALPKPPASTKSVASAANASASPSAAPATSAPSNSASPSSSASPSGSASPTGEPTSSASPSATPTKKAPAKKAEPIRPGQSGKQVLAMQKRLLELGYWMPKPDGAYGADTVQAVYAFQKAAGLKRDGVVGTTTLKALDQGIRPTAKTNGDGIEIDLKNQLLFVVRDGLVIWIMNTSTGSGQPYISSYGEPSIATTPKGTYKVWYTVDGPHKGKLGVLYRPRYFNGGIAVHGAASIPPYPASHGCARVSNRAMDFIWTKNLMPDDSRVTVR